MNAICKANHAAHHFVNTHRNMFFFLVVFFPDFGRVPIYHTPNLDESTESSHFKPYPTEDPLKATLYNEIRWA